MYQSILLHKIKKTFDPIRILKSFAEFLLVLIVVGTIITIVDILVFGILFGMSVDFVEKSTVLMSIAVTLMLYALDSREKKNIEQEEKNKDLDKQSVENPIEYNVQKTIKMEVVAKNEVTNSDGKTVRELLLRDPAGRVVDYGRSYYHKNLNTVFFTIELGEFYDFEWEFNKYDPTHKWSEYEKILKVDGKDVDLHQS